MIKKTVIIMILIISAYAKDWKTYTYVINDLIPKKEFKKAEKILSQKIKKHPNDYLLLWAQANVWGEEGKLDKAIVQLQQILNMPDIPSTDRNLITELLQKYTEFKQAKENQNIQELKDVISDNGLEFLMIFLSILVGELLARDVHECEDLKEEKLLKKFLNIKQKITFKDFKCFVISIGLFITYTAFIALIIILAELLIEPPYLKEITSDELQKHVIFIIGISFAVNLGYLLFKIYLQNKNLTQKVAEKILFHMYENERLFNKDIYTLKKYGNEEILNKILDKIEFNEEKKKIKEKYESISI